MSARIVFFLTTLVSEELRKSYEDWVSEVDTPLARKLPGVSSYRVVRLEDPVLEGVARPAFSSIEIIEIADLETYQEAIKTTPPDFFEQFRTYIDSFESVAGTVIN
jgi:hypothetical protein